MKHFDEGTIHAWLDGALSDAEARDVSQHAASCAECGAKVAEARGFIAGSSRILNSLDDVPAGISPKRAPAMAGPKAPTRARPFWQASPWVTGIAAALMLAIGIKEWRDRPSAQSALAPRARLDMDSLRATLPNQATPVDSTFRMRGVSAPTPKLVSAPPPFKIRRSVEERAASAGGAGAAGLASTSVDGPRRAPAENRAKELVAESQPLPQAAARGDVAKKSALADELKASAAVIPPPQSPAAAFERVATKDAKPNSNELTLAGCYRISSALEERPLVDAVAKSVAAAREPSSPARGLARAPAAAAPAPAATMPFVVPPLVRLDTTMTSRGRLVFSPTSGEAIGTWRAADGDSVRLAINLASARTISTSNRVACTATPEGKP